MSFLAAETVSLIRDTLAYLQEEEEAFLLASFEDANFFRKTVRGEAPKNYECRIMNYEGRGEAPPHPQKPALTAPSVNKENTDSPSGCGDASSRPSSFIIHNSSFPEPGCGDASSRPSSFIIHNSSFPEPGCGDASSRPSSFIIHNSSFSSVRKSFLEAFPGYPVIDAIPSDAIAIKIAERWKTKNKTAPISILSLHEPPEQRALLEQVAKALDVTFGSARVINAEPIEKEKQWDAFLSVPDLKIVVACDYTLWQLNSLMGSYKENPTQGSRSLNGVSLFLLPDLSLYLKDPLLKRSLWKALCQKLSS